MIDMQLLVKAKRKCDDKWIEGCYLYDNSDLNTIGEYHGIRTLDADVYEINPETVCRCTGRKDKNNNYIFCRDIIRVTYEFSHAMGQYGDEDWSDAGFWYGEVQVVPSQGPRATQVIQYSTDADEEWEWFPKTHNRRFSSYRTEIIGNVIDEIDFANNIIMEHNLDRKMKEFEHNA